MSAEDPRFRHSAKTAAGHAADEARAADEALRLTGEAIDADDLAAAARAAQRASEASKAAVDDALTCAEAAAPGEHLLMALREASRAADFAVSAARLLAAEVGGDS